MQLFQNNNNTLSPIEQDSFKLEKDLQSLIEANMETLFDLKFIKSEFTIGDSRLDSLAFDKKSKSFVIIEYKRGRSSSVIEQGHNYLVEMDGNQAEFVLQYNRKTGRQLEPRDIDWAASRVIFISQSFTARQKKSVNLKDVKYELWEIKKFENGLIALERYETSSTESIKKLSKNNKNSTRYKVPSEVKVLSEEDRVQKLNQSLKPLWGNIKESLADFSDTSFAVTKSYISWKRDGEVVCFIYFAKNNFNIVVHMGYIKENGEKTKKFFTFDDPKNLAKKRPWNMKTGGTGHKYKISLSKQEEINDVMFLLDQKYNSLG